MKKLPKINKKIRNYLTIAAMCVVSGFFWISLWFRALDVESNSFLFKLRQAEWQMQDWVVRNGPLAPVNKDIVFIGLDFPAYDEFQYPDDQIGNSKALRYMRANYPWSRGVWTEAIPKLMGSGAKVVVFDILFAATTPDDPAFAAVINKNFDRLILGANINFKNENERESFDSMLMPSQSLLGTREAWGSQVGIVNFTPDADGIIRRSNYIQYFLGQKYSSLARQAVNKMDPAQAEKLDEKPRRFRYGGPPRTYSFIPVYQLFLDSYWKNNFQNGAIFKDKIIMVGPAGNWSQDLQSTPYSARMFGPEVHIHAIAAALSDSFIGEQSVQDQFVLIGLAAVTAFIFLAAVQRPELRFFITIAAGVAYVFLIREYYNRCSYLLIMLPPLLCFGTASGLSLIQSFAVTLLEKIRARSMLERYVSANFVKAILDSPGDFEESLGGIRRKCTMLFSDIRGFTTMTESSDSQALVVQLNEYLSEMVECVFKNNGTLDKFIGDAVMAVWGNVQTRGEKEDAVDAVNTAIEMLAELKKLNEEWPERGFPELHIGIGVNHGEVVVGNMGSPRRKEFTVIGDPVNLASRLEGVTKEYGIELVLGESTAALVGDVFYLQSVDLIQVKGKVKPIEVYTVLGKRSDSFEDSAKSALELYEKGIRLYRGASFAEALPLFETASGEKSLGILSRLYIERCKLLIASPPDAKTWNGVWVMKSK